MKGIGVKCADWPSQGQPHAPPTVVIFPGLNNSSHWPFVLHCVDLLRKRGFTVCVFDYRATAGLSLTSPRIFGADSSRDFPSVLAAVRKRISAQSDLYAIGHSMGGTCLCKYLATMGDRCELKAAATISSPLRLSDHMRRLESSPSWRFSNFLAASGARLQLYKVWLSDPKSRMHLAATRWRDLRYAKSLRELEAATICTINGYADPEDYYAFSQPDVSRVRVPYLVVHAMDDPVISVCGLPIDELRANPMVRLVLTPHGGHLGYFESDAGSKAIDRLVAGFFLSDRRAGGGTAVGAGDVTAPVRARL